MSLETNSIDNVGTTMAHISNIFQVSDAKQDECNPFQATNPFGNYFQRCPTSEKQAYWGSDKPAPDVCSVSIGAHEGAPCHSLWNNLTRRKSVVAYSR
jgi:hypothetical protein